MTCRGRLAAAERALVEKLAAAAAQGWSEGELREIADGAGIPLDAVSRAMQALQRSDELPKLDDEEGEGRR